MDRTSEKKILNSTLFVTNAYFLIKIRIKIYQMVHFINFNESMKPATGLLSSRGS